MGKRTSLICFILLLISSMAGISIAAENDDDALSSTELNSAPVIGQEETDKVVPTKRVTTTLVPTKRVNTTTASGIKMIIGGDSKGGVAKQVILPVKD
jgi:hypothetical protein